MPTDGGDRTAATDATGRLRPHEGESRTASRRPHLCPVCGSPRLSFAEQLTSVTVYQCEDCGRAVSVAMAVGQGK